MDAIEGGLEREVDPVRLGDLEVLVDTPPNAGAEPTSAVSSAACRVVGTTPAPPLSTMRWVAPWMQSQRYATSSALTKSPTTKEAF